MWGGGRDGWGRQERGWREERCVEGRDERRVETEERRWVRKVPTPGLILKPYKLPPTMHPSSASPGKGS